MATRNRSKFFLFILVAMVVGAAGFGYLKQTEKLSDTTTTTAGITPMDQQLLTPKPNDIIIGDSNAIVTLVEYSSLSCPHCAHFHKDVLPAITNEFIAPGKVKLVVRHFPTNEPAMAAAQIVECADKNGLNREKFLNALFEMQSQWAFSENFLADLKKIATVGGIDSAMIESCNADKTLEARILTNADDGAKKLGIKSTPTFFINGIKYEGELTAEGFRAALDGAGKGRLPNEK